jgi:hypothetical protein
MRRWPAGLAILIFAAADVEARELNVPMTAGWKHAATGVILMAKIEGIPRTRLSDSTDSERDVLAAYSAPEDGLTVSIFIFRPGIADVPLWFDRAQTTLVASEQFKNNIVALGEPVAFAAAGSSSASSLRQTYAVQRGPFRSTGVVAVPLGDWIVTVRMSSEKLAAEALDARLQQFIAAIRWPAAGAPAPVAVRIKACTKSLSYANKAKVLASDVDDVRLSRAAATNYARQERGEITWPSQTWCRDGEATAQFGVYRFNLNMPGYALAIGDSGRVINVMISLSVLRGEIGRYSVIFTDVDGTVSSYASFRGIPRPEQAFEMVMNGQRSAKSKGN